MSDAANQPGYFRKLATILLRIVAIGYGIQGLCWALKMVEPGFRSRERRRALGVQSSPRQTRGASA